MSQPPREPNTASNVGAGGMPAASAFGDEMPIADETHIKREKAKARELRNSQWWKNLRGRGACHYCLRRIPPRELTMDHVVPLMRGGTSSRSNVVPCCKDCNSRKKHLLPIEWQDYLDDLARRPGVR